MQILMMVLVLGCGALVAISAFKVLGAAPLQSRMIWLLYLTATVMIAGGVSFSAVRPYHSAVLLAGGGLLTALAAIGHRSPGGQRVVMIVRLLWYVSGGILVTAVVAVPIQLGPWLDRNGWTWEGECTSRLGNPYDCTLQDWLARDWPARMLDVGLIFFAATAFLRVISRADEPLAVIGRRTTVAATAMRVLAVVNGGLTLLFAVLGLGQGIRTIFFRVPVVVAVFLLAGALIGRGRWPGIALGLLASAAYALFALIVLGFGGGWPEEMLRAWRVLLLANGWGIYTLVAAAPALRLKWLLSHTSVRTRWIALSFVLLGLVILGWADRRDARIDAEVLAAAEQHLADMGRQSSQLGAFRSVAWGRRHPPARGYNWLGRACFERDCHVRVFITQTWRSRLEVYKTSVDGLPWPKSEMVRGASVSLLVGHPELPSSLRVRDLPGTLVAQQSDLLVCVLFRCM